MYAEHRPPPALAPLVECFWTIRSRGMLEDTIRHRVLPDGCMDLIFDLGDPPPGSPAAHHRPGSYVVGTMPTAVVVAHGGRVDLLGVRFRPGGATPVTGLPANELSGRVVALAEVVADADALELRLRERRGPSGDGVSLTARRLRLLAGFLQSRFAGARRGADPRVLGAGALIERQRGRLSVGELARHVGTGRRQLERVFARDVGCSPAEACAVARFRGAVARLDVSPDLPLARLAILAGYYDQPHMTREFRRLAGIPPAALRRERHVASVQDRAAAAV